MSHRFAFHASTLARPLLVVPDILSMQPTTRQCENESFIGRSTAQVDRNQLPDLCNSQSPSLPAAWAQQGLRLSHSRHWQAQWRNHSAESFRSSSSVSRSTPRSISRKRACPTSQKNTAQPGAPVRYMMYQRRPSLMSLHLREALCPEQCQMQQRRLHAERNHQLIYIHLSFSKYPHYAKSDSRHRPNTVLTAIRDDTAVLMAPLLAFCDTPVCVLPVADAVVLGAVTRTLLSGRLSAAAVGCVPIEPEPTITYSPHDGTPSKTKNIMAGPGWKSAALGGIWLTCRVVVLASVSMV